MARVRKAGNLLDPGNVSYQVMSKFTGDISREKHAVPGSGLIDADDDMGHMGFGDLNVNVHGYRATLCDTLAKLVWLQFRYMHICFLYQLTTFFLLGSVH